MNFKVHLVVFVTLPAVTYQLLLTYLNLFVVILLLSPTLYSRLNMYSQTSSYQKVYVAAPFPDPKGSFLCITLTATHFPCSIQNLFSNLENKMPCVLKIGTSLGKEKAVHPDVIHKTVR